MEMTEFERDMLREKGVLPLENGKFITSNSIQIKNQTFKSVKCSDTQSIDYYMEMRDGIVGCAKMYIQYENVFYVMLEEFEIIQKFHHLMRIQ